MASTTARSAHAERRANGAYPDKASARARMSGTDSQASDRYEQRYREGSPQINAAAFASTSHKRSASGNPRPTTRTTDERRTEKVQVTTRETLVSRTRSPDRRNSAAQRERTKATDGAKMRPPEPKVKDQKPEPAPQAPWEPIASLLPHTTAPLACRISLPPLASQAPQALQPKPLHELSLESQEAVILEDLLFVFMGFEGQYIRFSKTYNPHEERDRLSGPTFRILPGLDPSLQDLTQAMLKMASHYSALQAFVDVQSRDEFGSVNHALCASIRGFLQNYLNLVAQLETQFLTNDSFTLHVLNIHVLPTGQMLAQLYAVAHELMKKNALLDDESDDESTDDGDDYDKILDQLREGGELVPGNMAGNKICKGGVVLGLITKRLEDMAGDPSARALLTTLLRDASRPYMRMLNEWLHHGGIKDPHSEFLIKEQKSIRRERLEQDYTDEYWERRYTIRDHDIPPQLVGVKDKVLLAGKYLNVVRECGGVDVSKEVKDVPTSFDDARFLDNVNNAYAHANESLMQLLVTTHALPARLRSLKHYFFLDPSDYFSYFLELGASELRRNVKQVNIGKLQSLLDLVLRQPGTIVSMDPFKEDVKVEMNEVTLIKSLQRVVNITGIEQGETLQPVTNEPTEPDKHARGFTSLQLDYAVPFPVSLVISRKTIWRYQALFRYLLSLRHMESQLCAGWQHTMRSFSWTYKSSSARLQILKQRVWTLRARMLVFVQQLLYFCTAEVIEPNWQALMSRLDTKDGASRTVDELMQDHVDFLDTCLKECMLTNSKLLKIYAKLMQTCHYFTNYLPWLTLEIEMACPELSRNERPANVSESQWRQFMLGRDERRKALENSNQGVNNPPGRSPDLVLDNLLDIFKKWEHQFGRHLQILLDALNHYAATETVVLLSLCARLSTANQGTEWAGRGHGDEDASAL